ncbi:MAG: serine acetyltransferase [Candidatus Methanofastidiosa archaeon]|nr:serine acetyltransferase [Candidatus Methanofastidiosa archaeon]
MKEYEINFIASAVDSWFNCSIYRNSCSGSIDITKINAIWDQFEDDYRRYFHDEKYLDNIIRTPALQGILCYRIARNLFLADFEKDAEIYSNLGRFLSGFEIYFTSKIGHGLKVNHGLGTVIGARCLIGNNCTIHQNVTLGDRDSQRPTLCDSVIIFAGAKILGGITIGNNAIVGANAVVMIDVPPNTTAVGVPARIIK